MKRTALIAAASAFLAFSACSARRGEPLRGPADLSDPAAQRGRVAFMAKCHKCHPGGDAGLGPAINNKPLPGFLIRFQTRHGLGTMPAFGPGEIPPEELEGITAYLKALRKE